MTRVTRRVLVAVVGLAIGLTVIAPPADAHTLTGVSPTNYRSELISLTPPMSGVTLRLLDLGREVELRDDSATTLVVLGYDNEPYLRVGPDGDFENSNSPSTYTNRSPSESLPQRVTPSSPPAWHELDHGHTVRWRDQRVRWEGAAPAEVQRAPRSPHVVREWQLTLQQGETAGSPAVFALGTITYVPPPSPIPWIMLIVIVGLAVVFATADGRRTKLLAASVAALVAIDTINAAGGVAFGTSGLGSIIGTLFTRDSLTSLAWLSGIAALVFLRRGDRQAFTLAAATAWVITVTSGLSDLGVFGQSVIPSKLDPNVVRAYTALTIGIGLALSITAGLHAWQTRSSPAAPTPTKGGARRRR